MTINPNSILPSTEVLRLQPNYTKLLSSKEVKDMIHDGRQILVLLFKGWDRKKKATAYIVEKDNPTHIIGRVPRTILSNFDTQPWAKPFQLHEIM